MDLMWKSMDLNNTKTLRELVNDKIKEIFSKKWNLEDFIQSGVWKPEKKNITLNNFVERMKQENKMIPTPGERFNYVIIKRYPYKYDYKGRQIELSKADKMEYLDIVKKYNYDIDLKYYFDNQLTGQFARLISYDEEFEIMINGEIDDDKTLNACKKYILKLVDQFNNTFIDRKQIFKDLYKSVNSKYQEKKNNIYDKKFNILLNSKCKVEDSNNIYKIINDNIDYFISKVDNLEEFANSIVKSFRSREENAKLNSKHKLLLIYNNKNNSYYIRQQYLLQNKFNKELDNLLQLLNQYNLQDKLFNVDNLNIINLINHIKELNKLDNICDSNIKNEEVENIIENTLNETIDKTIEKETELNNLYVNIDEEILNKVYNKYITLISIKKNKLIHQIIYNNLYKKLFSNNEYIQKPKTLDKLVFN